MPPCEQCGAALPPRLTGRPRRFCLECKPRKRPLVPPKPKVVKLPPPVVATVCEACGTEGIARRPGRPSRFCSLACREWARQHPGEKRVLQRLCGTCGVDISHRVYKAKFCSPACGWKSRQVENIRPCDECGDDVTSEQRIALCGPCRLARKRERWRANCRRRRALKLGAVSESYTVAEIAERDGHRCGLCRRKVNPELIGPGGMSPSIDHILPLSLGGDDTKANVQLAHWICNSRKGNRGGGEQLALLG